MDQGKLNNSRREEESTHEDQTTEKRQISNAAAVRQGNRKTNLFRKKEQHKYPKIF